MRTRGTRSTVFTYLRGYQMGNGCFIWSQRSEPDFRRPGMSRLWSSYFIIGKL